MNPYINPYFNSFELIHLFRWTFFDFVETFFAIFNNKFIKTVNFFCDDSIYFDLKFTIFLKINYFINISLIIYST
jgi:hypothetical protein